MGHPAPASERLGWFLVWMVVGVAIGVTLELVVFLPLSVLAALAVARWLPRSRDGWEGAISGLGLPFLLVAYINHDPGDLSPWPWLVVGLGLLIAGVLLHRRARAGP
jgi:membrane protein implicated in regulation of membrane protease activity